MSAAKKCRLTTEEVREVLIPLLYREYKGSFTKELVDASVSALEKKYNCLFSREDNGAVRIPDGVLDEIKKLKTLFKKGKDSEEVQELVKEYQKPSEKTVVEEKIKKVEKREKVVEKKVESIETQVRKFLADRKVSTAKDSFKATDSKVRGVFEEFIVSFGIDELQNLEKTYPSVYSKYKTTIKKYTGEEPPKREIIFDSDEEEEKKEPCGTKSGTYKSLVDAESLKCEDPDKVCDVEKKICVNKDELTGNTILSLTLNNGEVVKFGGSDENVEALKSKLLQSKLLKPPPIPARPARRFVFDDEPSESISAGSAPQDGIPPEASKAKSCGTKTSGNVDDLKKDLRCGGDDVCDLSKKKCVPVSSISSDLVKTEVSGIEVVGKSNDVKKLKQKIPPLPPEILARAERDRAEKSEKDSKKEEKDEEEFVFKKISPSKKEDKSKTEEFPVKPKKETKKEEVKKEEPKKETKKDMTFSDLLIDILVKTLDLNERKLRLLSTSANNSMDDTFKKLKDMGYNVRDLDNQFVYLVAFSDKIVDGEKMASEEEFVSSLGKIDSKDAIRIEEYYEKRKTKVVPAKKKLGLTKLKEDTEGEKEAQKVIENLKKLSEPTEKPSIKTKEKPSTEEKVSLIKEKPRPPKPSPVRPSSPLEEKPEIDFVNQFKDRLTNIQPSSSDATPVRLVEQNMMLTKDLQRCVGLSS